MRQPALLLTLLLVVQASAQSTNLLSILISEGYSIFTSFTYSLGQTATATGTPNALTTSDGTTVSNTVGSVSDPFTLSLASTTSPSASRSRLSQSRESTGTLLASSAFSSGSSTTRNTSPSASITSPTATQTSSPTPSSSNGSSSLSGSAAAASNTSLGSSSNGSSRDRTLAIALGVVLGALALGLFLLLLIILCGRRRRRKRAGTTGSLSPISDEVVAAPKRASQHRTPLAAAFGSRRSGSVSRKGVAGVPLMSERPNHDATAPPPAPYNFRETPTVPFSPNPTNARKSSGLLPTQSGTSLRSDGRFREGTGLNNHPYHDGHHGGSALAAGVGGAALGAAAAARHSSRSSERHHDPRLSGENGVHPAFWDEPPPRSSKRSSMDSTRRRSGSMPRERFYGPQEHASSPLRNSTPATATGVAGAAVAAGAGTGALASHERNQGHDRGRSPIPQDQRPERVVSSEFGGAPGAATGLQHDPYSDPSIAQHLTTEQRDRNSLGQHQDGLAADSTHLGADTANQGRPRSHPRTYPLPPSLLIPNPYATRNQSSRSPKRARFSGGATYHEPVPVEGTASDDNGISPPDTARSNSWSGLPNRLSTATGATDELVSPVSAHEPARGVGQDVSMVPGKANLVSHSQQRPVSPTPPADRRVSDDMRPISPPSGPSSDDGLATVNQTRKRDSGLITAVQDQFNPANAKSQPQPHSHRSTFPQPPTYQYQAYNALENVRPSTLSQDNTNASSSLLPKSQQQPPITRKPVPRSRYSGWKPLPQVPRNTARASGENWWRSQEDSAWTESYGNVGRAQ